MISYRLPEVVPADDPDLRAILNAESSANGGMLEADTRKLRSVLADGAIYIHSSGVIDSDVSYMEPIDRGLARYDSIAMESSDARRLSPDVYLLSGRAASGLVDHGKTIPLDNNSDLSLLL